MTATSEQELLLIGETWAPAIAGTVRDVTTSELTPLTTIRLARFCIDARVSLGKDLVQVAVKQLRRFWHWIDPLYCSAGAAAPRPRRRPA